MQKMISDYFITLLAEEMLQEFGRARTPKRCMLSVDPRKAFEYLTLLGEIPSWKPYE